MFSLIQLTAQSSRTTKAQLTLPKLIPDAYSASVGSLGSPGGTWTLEKPTTTPEPSSLMMLGVGLLGLAGLALKRSA